MNITGKKKKKKKRTGTRLGDLSRSDAPKKQGRIEKINDGE